MAVISVRVDRAGQSEVYEFRVKRRDAVRV